MFFNFCFYHLVIQADLKFSVEKLEFQISLARYDCHFQFIRQIDSENEFTEINQMKELKYYFEISTDGFFLQIHKYEFKDKCKLQ